MSQDKRGNNEDDGNVLVKVTVRRGNARAMGATPGTTVQSRRYIANNSSYVSGSSSGVRITVRRGSRGSR